MAEKNLIKEMHDEMNEEFAEAFISNIQTLIPKEWKPKIDEMLPKILKLVKHGLSAMFKKIAKDLGDNKKIFVIMNYPVKYIDKDTVVFEPYILSIETEKLLKFELKEGEKPEWTFSFAEAVKKIQSYKTIESLITDLQGGKIISLPDEKQENPKQEEKKPKQIESPKS